MLISKLLVEVSFKLCEMVNIDVKILSNMYFLPPSYNREVLASSFKILLETITAKRVMNTSISFYPKAEFTFFIRKVSCHL